MEIRQLQSAPSSPHPSTPHSPTYRQGCSGDTQSPELSHSQIRATVSQKAQTANTGARKCRKTASSHNAELAGWRPDGGDVTLRWPSSGPERSTTQLSAGTSSGNCGQAPAEAPAQPRHGVWCLAASRRTAPAPLWAPAKVRR